MRNLLAAFLFIVFLQPLSAQTPVDSGVYLVHKFQRNVGQEHYTVLRQGNTMTYAIDFRYVDRGRPVALTAGMQLTSSGEPLSFRVKGGTSRFSVVDDSVAVRGNTAYLKVDDSSFSQSLRPHCFPVAGYAPATAQELLIGYWKKHGQPATVHLLPFGAVQISRDGGDTVLLNGTRQALDRYVVKGLIWGNEWLWTDNKGQLICLITNDAEGDKQEIIRAFWVEQLPVFIDKAALHGMRLFTRSGKASLPGAPVVAIIHGRLPDLVTGEVTPDATVVMERGVIRYAGPAMPGRVPKGARVVDAGGKTILPGLWDMHAHFQQAEWGPAYLAAGVTTVRDCGNEFGYINTVTHTIDAGKGVGPRILKAGIIDGKGPNALGIIQADTDAEARAAVRRYKENGFAQIKIYSSVKPAIVKSICAEAHRLGLTVSGHVPNGMTLMQAVDSGMDMVNHIQYVYGVLNKDSNSLSVDFTDPQNRAVLDFIRARGVVVDPTLSIYELIYRSLKDSITLIEPAFATLPSALKPLFTNTGTDDSSQVERGKKVMSSFKHIVGALYKEGIPVVAGSDMDFPGYSVYRELELYVQSGLTPLQALQTATLTPAKVMKLEEVPGHIAAGKKADIILVDGDPLSDIRQIRKVTLVIKNGVLYDPDVLHRLAGFEVK